MNILADQNIPGVTELFADLGTVTTLPGREICADHLRDVEILLVRSVTQVNAALLANTAVQFVGSCTIGTDHLDSAYLDAQGIYWAYAPGCNAGAVVQYVLSAMASVKPQWQQQTVGIIGGGTIGGRLYRLLQQLGVGCCCYDPFLATPSLTTGLRTPGKGAEWASLATVLQADIVTCHVPLTDDGPYPTRHLLGAYELAQLAPDALLINSSRGGVIDEQALQAHLSAHRELKVVLDVWQGEPVINQQLLAQVSLGTPHIAGYSLEGKARGSVMIYQALCDFLQRQPQTSAAGRDRAPWPHPLEPSLSDSQQLNRILTQSYAIADDDRRLRQGADSGNDWGHYFDRLRKHYPVRREYGHYQFPEHKLSARLRQQLAMLSTAEPW